MTIGETPAFNEICGHLRQRIEESHYRERGRAAGSTPVVHEDAR
jgi:hypothetical protein